METMSWQQQLSGADVYLKRVKNSNSYSPDLLYNLCAMAIEQYFMALCVYKNVLPENHRFSDLVDAVSSFTPVDGNIIEDLKKWKRCRRSVLWKDIHGKKVPLRMSFLYHNN